MCPIGIEFMFNIRVFILSQILKKMTTSNHALLDNLVKYSSIHQIYEPVNTILLNYHSQK